ncbi:MAG: class I SAM-dependent methyltransferase [Chloroflexi bacterium]|nr:class I SAM-dependent methyltransferase [Chloroflexota bacterium]
MRRTAEIADDAEETPRQAPTRPEGGPSERAEDIVRAGYNAIAVAYTEDRREDSDDVRLLAELARRLPRGAKVLDAGCGAGVPITRILAQRFEVTGVDFSAAQIALARENVPQARFFCRDITQLDFPDGSFDAIVSYYAIIHVRRESHRPLLENFRRMLKPGGWALLCLGANDLPDYEDNFMGAPMYWSHYDTDTYLDMLSECGFAVEWHRLVPDSLDTSESVHLFVLAQRSG